MVYHTGYGSSGIGQGAGQHQKKRTRGKEKGVAAAPGHRTGSRGIDTEADRGRAKGKGAGAADKEADPWQGKGSRGRERCYSLSPYHMITLYLFNASMTSLNPYHMTHCTSLKLMLRPYIIQWLNEFIEPISYGTLFAFPVSYDKYNVT